MKPAPLGFLACLLLGFGIGWWMSSAPRIAGPRVPPPAQSTAQPVDQPGATDVASFASVLKLGAEGGGLPQDAALAAALRQLSADDFRRATALWTEETQDDLFGDEVRARAILDRWFELDPQSAKAFARKTCTPAPGQGLTRAILFRRVIAASAAASDPSWALEHLLHETPFLHYSPNRDVMREAVKRDPALAQQWMQRMEKTKLYQTLLPGYVDGIAESDPLKATEIAVAEKGFERQNLIPTAIRAAAGKGRGTVLEALAKIDDPEIRRQAALSAVRVLAEETSADPFQFLDEAIGRDHLDPNRIPMSFLSSAVESNPESAANWAATLPDACRSEFLSAILEDWRRLDRNASLDWLQRKAPNASNPEDPSGLADLEPLNSARRLLVLGKTQEAVAALGEVRNPGPVLDDVVRRLTRADPINAAQWVANLPPTKARDDAVAIVAYIWAAKDPAATAAWIEQMPAGDARNRALESMVGSLAHLDVESASQCLPLYTDSKERDRSVKLIYSSWSGQNHEAARNWVRGLAGFDERWKTKFLRRNP